MMICPQCNATYTDDFLFCLADGNSLRDESGETPPIVSHTSFSPDIESTDAMTICVGCGHANRANSRFCKKCGKALSDVMPETVFSVAPPPPPYFVQQQPQFTPPVFTPPTPSGQQFHAQRNSGNQTMSIVAGALLLLVIVVGVIAYNAGSEKTASNSSSSNTNKAANTMNAASNAVKTAANAASPNDSRIGKTGRLDTNLNIRSAPNKTSEILGTHYEGAKLRIMSVESFTAEDGEHTTWYKVTVIEDGYDSKTGNGKGNNWERYGNFGWMEAQREGWMNAKYITLE